MSPSYPDIDFYICSDFLTDHLQRGKGIFFFLLISALYKGVESMAQVCRSAPFSRSSSTAVLHAYEPSKIKFQCR
jgi:hypothetical protein